ncbi:hypothetical protein BH11PSE2_BH11PSE2_05820 [soil metagenome]
MIIRAAVFALALSLPAAALAAPPAYQDSSYVEANGDRAQRLSIVVPATPGAIWSALSTAEGWKSWAVATAFVDFRPGGQIETSYKATVTQGERDNIKNQIVTFVPDRLLAFRNVQAPRDFKDAELFSRVLTVIELEPAGKGATKVMITGVGYGQGPGWDGLYSMFLAGNGYTLEKLKERFEPK